MPENAGRGGMQNWLRHPFRKYEEPEAIEPALPNLPQIQQELRRRERNNRGEDEYMLEVALRALQGGRRERRGRPNRQVMIDRAVRENDV